MEENKKSNKAVLIIVGIILLLVIIGLVYALTQKNDNVADNDINISENVNDTIYFYKEDNKYAYTLDYSEISNKDSIVSKYECNGECQLEPGPRFGIVNIFNEDKTALINFSKFKNEEYQEKYVFYNIEKQEIIGEYLSVDIIGGIMVNDTKYLFVSKDGKIYGIIDKSGNIIHEFNMEKPENPKYDATNLEQLKNYKVYSINNAVNSKIYSLDNNLLVVIKNQKYGIEEFTTGKVLVDYKYDNIMLESDKYFKARENGKWYLYNMDTKNKMIDDGYAAINVVDDNIIVTADDNYIYIKDSKFNNLPNGKIEIPIDQYNKGIKYAATVSDNPGFSVYIDKENSNIIQITIGDPDDSITYKYNISNYSITKE